MLSFTLDVQKLINGVNKMICYMFQMTPKPTVFDVLNFFVEHVRRFLSVTEPKPMATNNLDELGIWGEYGSQFNDGE